MILISSLFVHCKLVIGHCSHMNKLLIGLIAGIAFILSLGAGAYYWFSNGNGNTDDPKLVETPPEVSKVNALALAKRPYVELVPHSNKARCDGVDLQINNLKNGEAKVEYELEYTTATLIQGVFGRREFSEDKKKHDPLEFGTCSKGRCKCDDDITGGSLKLSFEGSEPYILKGDFTVQNVGEKAGLLTSRDVRLNLDVNGALDKEDDVMITSTFGLPGNLEDTVLQGPYGIFVEDNPKLKASIKATIQSKDVSTGKVQYWDGKAWTELEKTVESEKATFELPQLGVVVLTQ